MALVDRILLQAMSERTSDIYVEPQQKGLRFRYRQDGVLKQYVEPLPSRLIPAVTSRFKILADLDIAERRQAQDGRIRAQSKRSQHNDLRGMRRWSPGELAGVSLLPDHPRLRLAKWI